jgi:predicted GNAT superfamily acetyltransferase
LTPSDAYDNGVRIRSLETSEEYQAFEDFQREVWGQHLTEVVTPSLARIVQKLGGIAAGAFDERGTMIGIVFGFTGISNGRPVHWSHMLAVRNNLRDAGIGRQLKLYQRDVLLRQGIDEVFWTYDPLVARNAHLNFNSLGVEVSEYVTDMYGPGDDSELFRGIGTDRFIVVWHIGSERVRDTLAGKDSRVSEGYKDTPIALQRLREDDPNSEPSGILQLHEARLRIEIPPDIHLLRDQSVISAARWRSATRLAITGCLSAGYKIHGFVRDGQTGRCFYCLEAANDRNEEKGTGKSVTSKNVPTSRDPGK